MHILFLLYLLLFLVHGGCPPASITQKRPNHGQVSVHGEPKFIEGQLIEGLMAKPQPTVTRPLVHCGAGSHPLSYCT